MAADCSGGQSSPWAVAPRGRKVGNKKIKLTITPWNMPITVAAQSKARIAFPCSNTGLVGSNVARSMNVCDFSICVPPCKHRLAICRSFIQLTVRFIQARGPNAPKEEEAIQSHSWRAEPERGIYEPNPAGGATVAKTVQQFIFYEAEGSLSCPKELNIKSTALWVLTPCRSVTAQSFGVTYRRHLQSRRVSRVRSQYKQASNYWQRRLRERVEGTDKGVRDESRSIYCA
jgi:hypothetical protein